jgi:hypothetical protein
MVAEVGIHGADHLVALFEAELYPCQVSPPQTARPLPLQQPQPGKLLLELPAQLSRPIRGLVVDNQKV